ncbi:MAG TPA: zinc-dependent metalloprotease family protein, partial [Pyrinomonadaceae bacterium]|nr:zinc-dependent metalloprotease family protein [Pyrinomonadaceae bacterium]
SRFIVFGSLAVVLCFARWGSFGTLPVKSKSNLSDDQVWREKQPVSIGRNTAAAGRAESGLYRTLSLNENAQRKLLRRAPMEFSKAAGQNRVVMALPMPDGKLARFSVEQSPVMEPRLAARFPEIKTYRGQGLDDPTATTRFDVTPAGFHAIVLSAHGTVIIEPAGSGRRGQYVSYDHRDSPKDTGGSFQCLTSNEGQPLSLASSQPFLHSLSPAPPVTTGATLRTYRLALAVTAEYTQTYGGGTVDGAFAAMTTTINAVNAIYERDLSIRLTLVNNETSLIFTNAATDPYTSDNVNSLLTQNQTVLDQRIGSSNYDVGFILDGHVYAFQPGFFLFQGAGQFRSVCVSGQKGKGVTILRSIEPSTISAIWDVAHELGHQFGALHTFNGTTDDCGSSRFPETAYEVGSGSTIMGYRGGTAPDGTYLPLCTFEDLHSVDTYFHATSIEQIVNNTTFGTASACPALTDTGNNPPAVEAGPDFTIPAQTPFTLTATASDPEADVLTYCWEEYDLGTAGPPHTDDGSRPIFRSFAPVASPARTFPQLSDVLSGTSTFGESLPLTTRTMTFRVTVRDNHTGSGGVNNDAMRVNVRADSGPFVVTAPGSSTTWTAGSTQTVTWNVANTAGAPVDCANVRILLSTDGGNSFPNVLAASTPNTGAATITVPNIPTSTARVKVEAIGNIFFNISLPSFTIAPGSNTAPVIFAEETANRLAALESVWFVRDPFTLFNDHNFSLDQRTRIVVFATGLELLPGENNSVITAQADYPGHGSFPLTVESVGKIPNVASLTQVNLRLPNELANAGDVLVSVSLRGLASNKLVIRIQ